MTTELCAYTCDACDIARRTGVTRIELCAAPFEGGTTPSAGLIRYARSLPGLRLSVMIRPRGGDFCYTDAETADGGHAPPRVRHDARSPAGARSGHPHRMPPGAHLRRPQYGAGGCRDAASLGGAGGRPHRNHGRKRRQSVERPPAGRHRGRCPALQRPPGT